MRKLRQILFLLLAINVFALADTGISENVPIKNKNITNRGTANISEILYAKLYFHLKKPKTCTLRIWLFC